MIKNKRYIINKVFDQLRTGDIVNTNGSVKETIDDFHINAFITGMVFKVENNLTFYIFNNEYNGSGKDILSKSIYKNKYKYSWCIESDNDMAWIELIGRMIEPKKLLLEKIIMNPQKSQK